MIEEKDLNAYIEEAKKEIDTSGMTCEDVWKLVDPYVEVPRGDAHYENVREDYRKSSEIYAQAESEIARCRTLMEEVEAEMNRSVPNGISQELFTRHYEVVRDLQSAFGFYTAILNRRACSGVVFLDAIKKGELPN